MSMKVTKIDDNNYDAESESGKGLYRVRIDVADCNCPDFVMNNNPYCKHMKRVDEFISETETSEIGAQPEEIDPESEDENGDHEIINGYSIPKRYIHIYKFAVKDKHGKPTGEYTYANHIVANGLLYLLEKHNPFQKLICKVIAFPNNDNSNMCIVSCYIKTKNGEEVECIGEADPGNVKKMKLFFVVMAETRAKGRAIRTLLPGIDMICIEEFSDGKPDGALGITEAVAGKLTTEQHEGILSIYAKYKDSFTQSERNAIKEWTMNLTIDQADVVIDWLKDKTAFDFQEFKTLRHDINTRK